MQRSKNSKRSFCHNYATRNASITIIAPTEGYCTASFEALNIFSSVSRYPIGSSWIESIFQICHSLYCRIVEISVCSKAILLLVQKTVQFCRVCVKYSSCRHADVDSMLAMRKSDKPHHYLFTGKKRKFHSANSVVMNGLVTKRG